MTRTHRAYSRASELTMTRIVLKQQYRAAADAYQVARSPEERDKLAHLMAVTISELQHPDLQEGSVQPC